MIYFSGLNPPEPFENYRQALIGLDRPETCLKVVLGRQTTLIAYAGSASVAIAALVIQYLLLHISPAEDRPCENPIDVLLLGTLRGAVRSLGLKLRWLDTPREERRWQTAFDHFILSMGDIQLAMGFAVLTYGYVTAFTEAMSVWHWWIIVGLAWFSVATNLTTALSLRPYFSKHPSERQWRTFLLACLIVALTVSMIPIIRVRGMLASDPGDLQDILLSNVLCYLPEKGPRTGMRFVPAAILMAIVCGTILVLCGILWLYERPGSVIFKWRDNYRGEMQRSFFGDVITCIRCEQRYTLLLVRPVLALWLVLRIYADLVNSVVGGMFCVMAMFAWVTMRFVDTRSLGPAETMGRWTFGQIVALVLFVAPFASLATYLWEIRWTGVWTGIFRRPQWLRGNSKQPVDQANENGDQLATPTAANGQAVNGPAVAEGGGISERTHSGEDKTGFMSACKTASAHLPSSWFLTAFPIAALTSLLHLVLLMVLPNILRHPSPADVFWKTIFWYLVYQPLLLFLFILAGMIVEERARRTQTVRTAYGVIAAITVGLSTGALADTLYGLGGIPMSYIGMGALGLGLLVYTLYGFVARPSPMAKGKGRTYLREGDNEENAPLLGPKRLVPDFRVRRPKLWHGPSRRPQYLKRKSYGTIDELISPSARERPAAAERSRSVQ
ncbi:hypothetical protein DL768_009332 [Monosporascus sp. mg162]|nr:hypothetical protein DL768_009332 [Monosporascus sp. mg162]